MGGGSRRRKVVQYTLWEEEEGVCWCYWVLMMMRLAVQFQGVDGIDRRVVQVEMGISKSVTLYSTLLMQKADKFPTQGEKVLYYSELVDYGGAFYLRNVEEGESETRKRLKVVENVYPNHMINAVFVFHTTYWTSHHSELFKVLDIRKPSTLGKDGPEIIFRRMLDKPNVLKHTLLDYLQKLPYTLNRKAIVEQENIDKALEERDEALNKYEDKVHEGGDVWKHLGKCAKAKASVGVGKDTLAYITLIKFYDPGPGSSIPDAHAIVSIQLSGDERVQYDIHTLRPLPPHSTNAEAEQDELKDEKGKTRVICVTCLHQFSSGIFMFFHPDGVYCELWKVASVHKSSHKRANYQEVFIYVALQLKLAEVHDQLRRKTPFLYMKFPKTTLQRLEKKID